MKQRTRSKRSIGGFTLLEMLVVIIVIGVLFAIAAPGWDTLLSRQRVSAAREQIVQTIRVAQSDARRSRSPRAVVFDMSTASKPRIANVPYIPDNTQGTATKNSVLINSTTNAAWVLLGNGDVGSGALRLTVNGITTNAANSYPLLILDGNGAVALPPVIPSATQSQLTYSASGSSPAFVITVSRGNSTAKTTDRCVIIDTILGAIRTEEGAYSGTTKKGCP